MIFSDMLGDHQIFFSTNLWYNLQNSDFSLAYLYLPKRIDYAFTAFHSARFLYIDDLNFVRFRQWGAGAEASYPIDRFNRFSFQSSWMNISRELVSGFAENQNHMMVIPQLSFIHDDAIWGYTAPANGGRYNFTVFGSPKLGDQGLGFLTATMDYRRYFKFWKYYSFASRIAAGTSSGPNANRFVLGGMENWINRQFDVFPISNSEDFAFLSLITPLRGYNYGAQIGTNYFVANWEFRFPLIRSFVGGPIPISLPFVLGAAFLDLGASWNHLSEFRGTTKDSIGNTVTQGFLPGVGFGARLPAFIFLLKIDVAWTTNLHVWSTPKWYFSIGEDF
jgi:outer membrane protein assembly factor BamA